MQRIILPLLALSAFSLAESNAPLLLREPSVSQTQIVFNYGGNLWIVGREGGDARRLTAGLGGETDAAFSPDGSLIAFSGKYNGNQDVYVVPASGGEPTRLTFHPGDDQVIGWTPDGRQILFASARYSFYHNAPQLFTVPVAGGFPSELPLPIAEAGSFSPDGTHLAYVPHAQWQPAWKRYRGGQTTPIWITDLRDSSIAKIPRENSNDFNPMWIGDKIYFLSDRNGAVSLYVYDTTTKVVSEALKSDGLDFKSASASRDAIVIEQFGSILLFDCKSQQAKRVHIRVAGDLEQLRSHYVKVEQSRIRNFTLSPTGARVLMEAWGEIFSIPSDKGDIRNLTHSPGVADRDPAWSPDGKWVAYFSDQPGEYELQLREQTGLGKVRHINLGSPPSFFYQPVFSPDSKKIAYSDKRLNLWSVAVDKDNSPPKLIDTDYYDGANFSQEWSPDSQWMAYTKQLPNYLHAVYLYSLEQGKAYQVTDGMSDAVHPVFDKSGKYLFFMASTDTGLAGMGFDMSGDARPVTRSLYVVVLSKDLPSPLAPESDEEKVKEEIKQEKQEQQAPEGPKKTSASEADKAAAKDKTAGDKEKDKEEKPVVVKVDIPDIGQRIVALPMPAKNYLNLMGGKSGILFVSEGPEVMPLDSDDSPKQVIQKFDLSKRKAEKFLEDVNDYTVSFNGEKLLYRKEQQWALTGTEEPPAEGGKPKPGEGPLKLDGMEVYVQPREMWQQIYRETWRIERDFFYDPNHHGLDLDKVEKKYAPYLENVASRDELTYLFEEALGEMTVGHMFVGGGYRPEVREIKTGLLGADFRLENGRYRVARVYNGENWNPGLQAPLTQPGVKVKAGDYILAVNGRELRASDEIYSFFEETAGKQVVLKVGPNPSDKDSREVTVIPVDSEERLRRLAWIEENRRRVDELSGGKVAYVYVPNTGGAGYSSFTRYYFAQVGKQAAIIDERFNEGGQLADYMIDSMRRPMMSRFTTREGHDGASPSESIYGPKVMIINEMAGSGGDALPWYFRKAGIGPLVGKRTWGGLVGIGDYPELIDGGHVTAPRFAVYGLNGDWEVENHGIAPDYEIDLDPAAVRSGHDPQLEKALAVVMELLKEHPLPNFEHPPYPNYHVGDDLAIGAHKRGVSAQGAN